MASADRSPSGRLWVEWYAAATGCTRLATRLLGPARGSRFGPYLFVTVVWLVTTLGFGGLSLLTAGTFPVLQAPGLLLALPPLLFTVYLLRRLRERYRSVVHSLPAPAAVAGSTDRSPAHRRLIAALTGHPRGDRSLDGTLPSRLRWLALAVALCFHAAWFGLDPSPMAHLIEVYGRVLALGYFIVVVPLVYSVVAGELLAFYIAIHLLLPTLVTGDGRISFGDPLRFGGLRPVGRLIRDSTASFLLLVAFFAAVEAVGPGTAPLDPFSRLLVVGGTAVAVVGFVAPVYWLHRFMRRMKEAKVKRLAAELSPGVDDARHDTLPADAAPSPVEYFRLTRVESMHEFPVDLSLVLEFCLVLLLPFLTDVATTVLRELVVA